MFLNLINYILQLAISMRSYDKYIDNIYMYKSGFFSVTYILTTKSIVYHQYIIVNSWCSGKCKCTLFLVLCVLCYYCNYS